MLFAFIFAATGAFAYPTLPVIEGLLTDRPFPLLRAAASRSLLSTADLPRPFPLLTGVASRNLLSTADLPRPFPLLRGVASRNLLDHTSFTSPELVAQARTPGTKTSAQLVLGNGPFSSPAPPLDRNNFVPLGPSMGALDANGNDFARRLFKQDYLY